MENLIKKYDLPALIEVVKDRAEDYSSIREEHEETYAGESAVNTDKFYPVGFGDKLDDVVNLLMDLNQLNDANTEDVLHGISPELENVLKQYIDYMVESHLEGWSSRYEGKSKEEVAYDLHVNHDPSIELDSVKEWLGRDLTDDEEQVVETFFNETVLSELFNPLKRGM